ncbi:MAG TPA: ABC transporter substrate-binding protein [Nitriliruptorales bacterium]|nr:ABC transporter substrate-binding protein [Nitriliruptorales bacterium]
MTSGRRVVSLLPSATEIVAAMGHGAELVGRSHECDFPPEVVDLPAVSRPRREPVGASRDIHRGVVDLLERVMSIYEVDAAALRAADPDLIITQDLCRVCAVAEEEVVQAARAYLGAGVEVLTSSPMTLDEVFADVLRIGEALDDGPAAERLVARMRTELDEVAATVAGLGRPRLLLLEWTDPLIAAGHWTPELVEHASARPVLGTRGGSSPIVTPEVLRDTDPDVILVAPCGYDLARAVEDGDVLSAVDGWDDLSAVRSGRVGFADGSAYFNRPGPRLVTSAAIVAALTHGVGPAMHLQGRAWQRWDLPGAGGRGEAGRGPGGIGGR